MNTRIIYAANNTHPNSIKKYTAIAFDLLNVLLDWQPKQQVLQLFPNTNAVEIIVTILKSTPWQDFNRGTISLNELAHFANHAYGFDEELTKQILTQLPQHLPEITRGLDILRRAKAQGYKVYVLSNAPKPFLETLIKKHPFFQLFDGVMASYEVGSRKPESAPYIAFLEKFSINAVELFFIDDLAANVQAGADLGIDGIVCQDHEEAIQIMIFQRNNY
jgi:putative hydrolase of the HAD superfamily